MAEQLIDAYATAMFGVASAQGDVDEVADELFRFARVLEANDEFRNALSDPHLPAARRSQIVEDVLSGKATDTTTALVSMVVATGRARDLGRIIDAFVAMSAHAGDKEVAEVRSAIDLTEDQRTRLAAALAKATGKDVEVKVIVDPTVMGGLVAQVGDTVIDGSVRHRLNQLREVF